jgi:uncharacterized protein
VGIKVVFLILKNMKMLNLISRVLVVIGALNWGLVAISANWNLVELLQVSWLIRLVYALVGLAALYTIFTWKKASAPVVPTV